MSTTANNTLLSQFLEAFQTIQVNENTIVISVLDSFEIGKNTDFGDDYSEKSMCIFAENLLLADSFKMKAGIVSIHSLTVSGDGLFNVSGNAGTTNTTINEDNAKKGENGGNGETGGNLSLYLELANLGQPTFKVAAKGGDGGAGQQGINSSTGTDGGDGGDGGNGGTVIIIAGLPYLQWVSQLRSIYQMSSLDTQKEALKNFLGVIPEDSTLITLRQFLNDAVSASTKDTLEDSMKQAGLEIDVLVTNFKAELHRLIDISGGKYGVYGGGKNNGSDGKHIGFDGSRTVLPFGLPNELIQKDLTPFFFIHPSQCARLLEKIKLMYWSLDPVNNPEGVKDVMTLLLRLQARTQLFINAKDDSKLVKFYRDNESKIGAISSVNQLRSIYNDSTNYLTQLKQGLNVFGYDSNHVPLASFEFYKNLLDPLIRNFGQLETYYKAYFDSLKNQVSTIDQIKDARDKQQSVISNAQSQIDPLTVIALNTAYIIDSYQTILPPLKQALEQKIKELNDVIRNHFDFNLSTVLQSLTTLAFAPESQFMIQIQASEFFYNVVTNVTNDQGVPVKKEYIVNQIKSVQSDLKSIQEGFQSLDDGTLASDDPGAGKLVAEEQQLMDFFKGFYDQFTPELDELKKAFEAYISKIIERNNQILTYNATVILMLKNKQIINAAQQRKKELNDDVLKNLKPDLPDLVTFVSGIYYSARTQIMEILDLTARAYRFWALSDANLIAEAYNNKAKALPQINHSALLAAQDTILSEYQKAIDRFGTNHQLFPSKPDQQGLIFEVSPYQVDIFKETHQLMVKIPTATRDTALRESIFRGMANVRVLLLRVWIDGVKTSDNQLQIKVTHTGKSQIVSQDGNVFSFSHEPVSKLFKLSNISTREIQEEANFGVENLSSVYASLSPFTSWNISVDPNQNSDLDLSEITMIRLEFHGTNYSF